MHGCHPRILGWLPHILGVILVGTLLGGLLGAVERQPHHGAAALGGPVVLSRSSVHFLPSTAGVMDSPAAAAGRVATKASPAPSAAPDPTGTPHATELSNFWGADISFPQCAAGPPGGLPLGFVIVGLNDGRPFTTNPCLAEQLSFARGRTGFAVYANIDAPYAGDPASYGQQVGQDLLSRLATAGLHPPVLWLDVEVANHWSTPAVNVAVIRAAVAALAAGGVRAGIYSSPPMWAQITGDAALSLPVWTAAVVSNYQQLAGWCSAGLGGRPATLAQYVASYANQLLDIDVLCSTGLPDSVTLFSPGG